MWYFKTAVWCICNSLYQTIKLISDKIWNYNEKMLYNIVLHWHLRLFQQEIVSWFNAIRSTKLNRLRIAFPGAKDGEVCDIRESVVIACLVTWDTVFSLLSAGGRIRWHHLYKKFKKVTWLTTYLFCLFVSQSVSHRCQHQRKKKRDKADEKAGKHKFTTKPPSSYTHLRN